MAPELAVPTQGPSSPTTPAQGLSAQLPHGVFVTPSGRECKKISTVPTQGKLRTMRHREARSGSHPPRALSEQMPKLPLRPLGLGAVHGLTMPRLEISTKGPRRLRCLNALPTALAV